MSLNVLSIGTFLPRASGHVADSSVCLHLILRFSSGACGWLSRSQRKYHVLLVGSQWGTLSPSGDWRGWLFYWVLDMTSLSLVGPLREPRAACEAGLTCIPSLWPAPRTPAVLSLCAWRVQRLFTVPVWAGQRLQAQGRVHLPGVGSRSFPGRCTCGCVVLTPRTHLSQLPGPCCGHSCVDSTWLGPNGSLQFRCCDF